MSVYRVWALAALFMSGPVLTADTPKERILWSWNLSQFHLYVSDADGEHERLLEVGPGSNYNPTFSVDGRWIVFTSERFGSADVFRIHPDGSGLERLTDSPAFDDQGALSPDGRTLAFVSTREGGTANIWLLDTGNKTHAVNLTRNQAGNFRPSWSPDGKWIAFSSDRDMPLVRYIRDTGPAWELMQTTAIYIVHPDGSGLRRLTALDGCAGTPKWSRDGRRVLFEQVVDMKAMRKFGARTQIVSIGIDTGSREVHSDGTNWASSPSYVGNSDIGYRNSQGTIVYASGRTGPATAAATPYESPQNPSWSPDGTLVVYDRKTWLNPQSIEVSRSRDPRYELISGTTVLDTFPPPFTVTPDGKGFVYVSDSTKQLVFTNWDGKRSRVVFDGGPDRNVGAPTVAADGRRLAFAIWKSSRPEDTRQMAVLNSDGSHFGVVPGSHSDRDCYFWSLSPEGTRLVCAASGVEHGLRTKGGLRIVSLVDGKTTRLTTGWDNTPAWSPRGDLIAFTGFETGDFEIYTIHSDGTGLRQLTHTHGNDAHPIWSPDGRWIAFTSSRKGWKDEALLPPWHGPQTYGEIFVMRADGTDVRQLTDNQWEEAASAWLPAASRPAISAAAAHAAQ